MGKEQLEVSLGSGAPANAIFDIPLHLIGWVGIVQMREPACKASPSAPQAGAVLHQLKLSCQGIPGVTNPKTPKAHAYSSSICLVRMTPVQHAPDTSTHVHSNSIIL